MPRKRFKGIDFQHSHEGSSSLPHEPEQHPQQSQQHWAGSSSTKQPDVPHHEPPTDDRDDEVVVGDFQIQDDQGQVRTRRRLTRARDVWQLRDGERIIVTCNSFGQPIKKSASLLSSFIGTVARKCQMCPINYASWNKMIPLYKIELLRVVQTKFVLPPESHDWVLKLLNRKWKEHKAKMKRDYKKEGMTEEEVARSCPPNVYPHQWLELVHYWFSEKGQTYSDIGRATRSSQSVPHTSGSKSYGRRRAEFVRNIMPRKRFKGTHFQHSQVGSSSLPHKPEQPDDPQRSQQYWAGSSSTQQPNEPHHEPPTDHRDDEVVVGDFQIQDNQGRVRTRRGPTRARDVWQLCEGEQIIVTCNNFGQPIKKSASLLSSFIGTVARKCQLCPINYARWNEMIPSYKIELLRVVQSKFVLPPESHDWVLQSFNRKWKEHKARMKRDYKKEGMTEEEVARSCPPDVYPHQWLELVHYWFSERGQTYSDIGRAARSSQSVPHTSGSKSYARRRAEFMEEHGREPGEVEFYRMTHIHRDGSFVREESRKLIDRATTLITEHIGDSSSSAECNLVEAQVFTELMGPERYGRVRGYGVGVTPTQLSIMSKYTQDCRHSSIAKFHRLETQVHEMRQSHEAQLQEMRQGYDRKIEQLSQSHQTEIVSLKTQIDQITSFLRDFAPNQALNSSGNRRDDDDDDDA